jgi:hypothetical protein
MKKINKYKNSTISIVIASLIFFMYFITLAPSIVWGDSAKLTLYAIELSPNWIDIIGGHPLHTIISIIFSYLIPINNQAVIINLVSAIFGAATIGLVAQIVGTLTQDKFASICASLSLGLSHTFWTYSVIAESYTIATFFSVLILYLLIYENDEPNERLRLVFAGLLSVVSILNNLLTIFVLPGYFYILYKNKEKCKNYLYGILLGVIFIIILILKYGSLNEYILSLASGVKNYIQLKNIAKEIILTLLYITYQFPTLFIFYIVFSLKYIKINLYVKGIWISTILVILFASTYQYQRHFVFLIMAYTMLSIIGGITINYLKNNYLKVKKLLIISIIIMPASVYFITPHLINFDNFISTRPVPGRDSSYFLKPWKNNRYEADIWSNQVLNLIKSDSVIYADFTLARVLQYSILNFENNKKIKVIEIDSWIFGDSNDYLQSILSNIKSGKNVYLAQNYESYYKINFLDKKLKLIQLSNGIIEIKNIE